MKFFVVGKSTGPVITLVSITAGLLSPGTPLKGAEAAPPPTPNQMASTPSQAMPAVPAPGQAKVEPGDKPAAVHTVDLSGKPLSLQQYHGKVVLLHFWTTSCPMCRVELPNVLRTYHALHQQGLEVIGVPMDDDRTKAQVVRYVRQQRLPWRVTWDGKGWESPLIRPYGADWMPFSLLIGRDGRVAAVDPRGPALETAIRLALVKPAPSRIAARQ